MKKLEVGDYVKNLTEKQFDKLMELQPKHSPKYDYVVGQTDLLYLHGYAYGVAMKFISIFPGLNQPLKTQLTYRQFLLRAKMTFNVAPMSQK
jgi:hypothetical protein